MKMNDSNRNLDVELVDLEISDADAENVRGGLALWSGLQARPSFIVPAVSFSFANLSRPTPFGRVPGRNPRLDIGIKR